jgi:membrane protease YdiL (CAAX protease family)
LVTLWSRLPALVRGILLCELVTSAGGLVSELAAGAALKLSPRVPWFLAIDAAWLVLLWRYLDGKGPPRRTAEARRRDLRAPRVPRAVWGWALLAGSLGLAACLGIGLLTPRFVEIPSKAFELDVPFARYPWWTVLALLVSISAVAGVVEEAGFRGYLLSVVQRRHGWVIATLVVGALFHFDHWVSHPYAATPAFFPFFLLISAVHVLLVYCTGSIVPSAVLHAVFDVLVIPYQYGLVGTRHLEPLSRTGVDAPFLVIAGIGAACALAAWPAFAKLLRVARAHGATAPQRDAASEDATRSSSASPAARASCP